MTRGLSGCWLVGCWFARADGAGGSRARTGRSGRRVAQAGRQRSVRRAEWRSLGPPRGGRSIAAAGSVARPNEYYMGATGGGLWKTTDGGTTWKPVTDGQIHSSSVGAVAIAPSNPDVVYIGTGESDIRGNIIQGDGAYKSTDGGKTWSAHRPHRDAGHLEDPRPSDQPRSRLRRGVRSSRGAEPGARRVPLEGRRQDLGQDPVPRQQDRRHRADPRSEQSAGHLRRACGRRTGTRGRCRAAGRAAASSSRPTAAITGPRSRATRACRRRCSARSACRSRAPIRIASTRRSKPRTAGSSCPTTPARRGRR